jgi:hypothetical protein
MTESIRQGMNLKKLFVLFLVWLALAVVSAAFPLIVLDWTKWHGLAKRAVAIDGRVTGKEQNHKSIRYSYQVERRDYTGLGSIGGGNPDFEHVHVGDSIKVFYDSESPEVSVAGDPQHQSSSIIMADVFGVIFGPAIGMFSMYRKGWLPVSGHDPTNKRL